VPFLTTEVSSLITEEFQKRVFEKTQRDHGELIARPAKLPLIGARLGTSYRNGCAQRSHLKKGSSLRQCDLPPKRESSFISQVTIITAVTSQKRGGKTRIHQKEKGHNERRLSDDQVLPDNEGGGFHQEKSDIQKDWWRTR